MAVTNHQPKIAEVPKNEEADTQPNPQPQTQQTPRIVSTLTSQEIARQKVEDLVKLVGNEGLAALTRLREEVDNSTFAMEEHQADLVKGILEFYRFTADTIDTVKVMENAMVTITGHFKNQK